MNKVIFQQTGGFPLETDTLNFVQESYRALQSLAAIAGDNFILSGVVVNGANVTDGFVVINGEVLPFKGGGLQTKVVIVEEVVNRSFENGSEKQVFVTRYAVFGTGSNFTLFSDLLRIKDLKTFRNLPSQASSAIDSDSESTLATSKAIKVLNDKINALIQPGMVLMWKGLLEDIPDGYELCEELRDRFVLGAGLTYALGDQGGENKHTLTIEEMPSHTHPTSTNPTSAGVHWPFKQGEGYATSNEESGAVGGGQAHNNMPLYYSLFYIIRKQLWQV
ncbi:hypothetical protein [Pedobacter sp. WC2423]|uniref:hypothetical protein n=1 Tax=Pedobacter sp. WC2423 TaxID=3234142 RepID=UPI0034657315